MFFFVSALFVWERVVLGEEEDDWETMQGIIGSRRSVSDCLFTLKRVWRKTNDNRQEGMKGKKWKKVIMTSLTLDWTPSYIYSWTRQYFRDTLVFSSFSFSFEFMLHDHLEHKQVCTSIPQPYNLSVQMPLVNIASSLFSSLFPFLTRAQHPTGRENGFSSLPRFYSWIHSINSLHSLPIFVVKDCHSLPSQ